MNQHRKLLFSCALLAISMVSSCDLFKKSNPQPTDGEESIIEENPIDSAIVSQFDWDEHNAPMYLIPINDHLFHVSDYDSALYIPNAASYTKISGRGGETEDIHYVGFNQGHEVQGSIIYNEEYSSHMMGLIYKYNRDRPSSQYFNGFAFTNNFINTHESIKFSLGTGNAKAPKNIIEQIEERYDNRVVKSWLCAQSHDKSVTIVTAQMKPVGETCLGMIAVLDGETLYTYADSAYYYEGEFTWHVDDEGEYGILTVDAIMRGESGLDIFCIDYAPESTSPGVLMARNGNLYKHTFSCYYNHIDYTPQPWPVDLPVGAELKAELDGYKVWVVEEIAPSEDNMAGQYSVYYQKPDDERGEGKYYRACSNSMCEESEKILAGDDPWPSYVGCDELLIASDVYLTKDPKGDIYLIVEGCPDMRNMFTYLLSMPPYSDKPYLRWFPTNAGYHGLDASGELLRVDTYRYGDEGRINYAQYYDFDMNLVREEPCPE